ncbi:hypothetical protein [Mycolicibacter arupensis]|jgi:hypothetical protein|uniref:GP55 protein n=1 Tax=Mycolicibacter arupensis TaxID=342002 RepID=A0A0F5MX85_9MYCO|nr:hypothetical protein [Mycolicibacter arupensis]KKB99296.1 hypothetical protein WR43_10415 [Mycolicibacter arupensis]MCV7275156.1 hypothetical protein [Mycolicibacter arupensis]OQZ97772.1 hypothetical protein BST15_09655 [Mycolicibacter arupensis]
MTPVLIGATVTVALYSLWVRGDTWRSRWEFGITLAIALETIGLVLMSPWAAETLGPAAHSTLRVWNIQQLAGHICFVIAVAANIYHVLARLADFDRFRPLFRRHVRLPVQLGIVAMVATFVVADAGYRPDGFSTLGGDGAWARGYWALLSLLMMYLAGYATRVLLMLRSDPRAKETIELYTASTAFAVAGIMAMMSNAWTKADVSPLIWLCTCTSVTIFAYGSARSWRAKAAWFTNSGRPAAQPTPPQALS